MAGEEEPETPHVSKPPSRVLAYWVPFPHCSGDFSRGHSINRAIVDVMPVVPIEASKRLLPDSHHDVVSDRMLREGGLLKVTFDCADVNAGHWWKGMRGWGQWVVRIPWSQEEARLAPIVRISQLHDVLLYSMIQVAVRSVVKRERKILVSISTRNTDVRAHARLDQ